MPDEGLNDYIKEIKNKERKREEEHRHVEPTVREMKEIKICPYCSEEILATAVKCKHCHSLLGTPGEKQDAVEEPNKKKSRYISVNEELTVFMLLMGVYGIYSFLTEDNFFAWFALGSLFVFVIRWNHVKRKFESQRFSKFLHYLFVILIVHWTYRLLIFLSDKYHW